MKKILLLLLFIPLISFGQEFEKEKIKSVIKTFFDGFHKKDSLLLTSVLEKSFTLNSTSFKENEGVLRILMEIILYLQLFQDLTVLLGKKNFFLMK